MKVELRVPFKVFSLSPPTEGGVKVGVKSARFASSLWTRIVGDVN